MIQSDAARCFLFLQGPISPFFAEVAEGLEARGHRCCRINLCFGDRLFWRRPGAINYRGSLAEWPDFIAAFMAREGVTDIVLLGEQRDPHRAAIRIADERGIRVVVTDFGYLRPDWITLERNGMSGGSHFPRNPSAIRELARICPRFDGRRYHYDSFWGMALRDILYHVGSWALWWTHPGYRSHQLHHPVAVYLGTALRMLLGHAYRTRRAERIIEQVRTGTVPYFVFPLQMATDFQIRAYSPYDDLHQPIGEIVESFARHAPVNAQLVVKIHPLDPGLVSWRRFIDRLAKRHGVAGRVLYIDGGSLDTLLKGARGVVTVNSTVGLTAIRLGIPVRTLGTAIYNVSGLVSEMPLDRFWSAPRTPDRALARDFLRAIAACLHIRGVFYARPGLDAAVAAAVDRLDRDCLNQPIEGAEWRKVNHLAAAAGDD